MAKLLNEKRDIIYMNDPDDEIDFITLHNILYFIYIGVVNLPQTREDENEPLPQGYPDQPDPFLLYKAADKFLLSDLKQLCYVYSEAFTTPTNVAEKLFHPECQYYPELKKLYLEYTVANFNEVRDTEGWERAVCQEDEAESPSVARYTSHLLFEISKRVTVSK
jgi:hypothetical protein